MRDSEEKFRKLFDNSSDAIFWSDVETGIIINCNNQALRLLERSRDEIIGLHHFIVQPMNERKKSTAQFKESIRLKRKTREDEHIITRSRNEVPVQITSSVIELGAQSIIQDVMKDISERKAWEKQIKESENKYRQLFESSNAGISLSTFERKIVEANEGWTSIFGYSRKEFLEMNIVDIYVDHTERVKLINILNQKGQVRYFETQIITKDNITKWISLTSRVIRVRSEDQILTIITDIDQEKRLETELRKSQSQSLELYKTYFANNVSLLSWLEMRNPVAIGQPVADQVDDIFKEAYIKDISEVAAEVFGFNNREEMIGRQLTDIWHEESYERGGLKHQQYQDIIREGYQSRQKVVKSLTLEGKERWFITSTQLVIKNNCIMRIWSSQFDITKQKLAEEDAIQSSVQYQTLFQNMIDGFAYHRIILKDGKPVDYEFIDINESFTRLTRITREMVIGKRVTKALPGIENDSTDWIGIYGDVALNQTSNHFEAKSEQLGKWFRVHTYSPKKEYFVAIFTDITDQNKVEEDRSRLLKIESLSLLAGGIAHDYNNLLVGILGNVNLLQLNKNLDSEIIASLNAIEKATFRASDLTKQLLTFSKGGAPLTKPESIKNIIRDSISFVLRGSKSKPSIIYEDDLPAVEVDAGQISQLINNITINADQSMSHGGIIRIEVKTVNIFSGSNIPLKEGKYVTITIQDEGSGMEEEILQNIFDPYFTTKSTGSGLGLATSYSIVNRHNGYIDVKSTVGVGSTFTIYLPSSESREIQNEVAIQTLEEFEGRVLIMDDDDSIRKIMKELLNRLGFTVDLVEEGQRAIELYNKSLVENYQYVLVIMDLTIPGGLGGKEVISKLIKIDPNINAIVSSGYSNDPVLSNFENYGFKGRLLKPFSLDQLKQAISMCLSSIY